MGRHALHVAAALLTFTVGFLTAGAPGSLAYALPLALAVFFALKVMPRLDFDLHFALIATFSVLLWSAGAHALFTMFPPGGGSCVIEFSGEEISQPDPPVPPDTVITLERTGCFGTCRGYTLSIFADGSVVFYGAARRGSTGSVGAARSWMSQEQIRRLLTEFDEVGYFSLKDTYKSAGDGCPSVATHVSSAITSIQINGRRKTVEHYHGCMTRGRRPLVYPQRLTELEASIDEAAASAQWVK